MSKKKKFKVKKKLPDKKKENSKVTMNKVPKLLHLPHNHMNNNNKKKNLKNHIFWVIKLDF